MTKVGDDRRPIVTLLIVALGPAGIGEAVNTANIRLAESEADREAAADLFMSAGDWQWMPTSGADKVTLLAESGLSVVAALNGRTFGDSFPEETIYEHIDAPRAWLDFVAVNPAMKRDGLGRALVHAFAVIAKERGCTHIVLTLKPGPGLPERIAFFQACGMTDISLTGDQHEYMGGLVDTVMVATSPPAHG